MVALSLVGADNCSYQTVIIGSLGATLHYSTIPIDISFILAITRQLLSFRILLSPLLMNTRVALL